MTTKKNVLQFKNRRKVGFTPLKRVSRSIPAPASRLQEALFLHNLVDPQSVSLNVIHLFEIEGCANPELFRQVFDTVVSRHEIFRTYLEMGEDKVCQRVIPAEEFNFPLKLVDLSHLDKASQEQTLKDVIERDGYAPFNLSQLPLHRFQLFKLSNERLALFRCVHHALTDAGSMRFFLEEVSREYDAAMVGKSLPVTSSEFEFIDYATWERETLTDDFLKPQLEHWKMVYKRPPEPLRLPFDFPRPASSGKNFEMSVMTINSDQWNRLKELALTYEASIFQANFAIIGIFLHRYCNVSDFCIGSSIDHRRSRGLPEMWGPLLNEFVVRYRVQKRQTGLEFLRETVALTRCGYMNADVVFEKLIAMSGLKRVSNFYSLYQVEFFYRKKQLILDSNLLNFVERYADSGAGDMDLLIEIAEGVEEAELIFRYNHDLFLPSTIHAMQTSFLGLYAEVLNSPSSYIEDLPLTKSETVVPKVSVAAWREEMSAIYEAPKGTIEGQIADVWRAVLQISTVDRRTSFFALGGTPSDLLRVKKALRAVQIDLDFLELYNHPTIAELSQFIEARPLERKRSA